MSWHPEAPLLQMSSFALLALRQDLCWQDIHITSVTQGIFGTRRYDVEVAESVLKGLVRKNLGKYLSAEQIMSFSFYLRATASNLSTSWKISLNVSMIFSRGSDNIASIQLIQAKSCVYQRLKLGVFHKDGPLTRINIVCFLLNTPPNKTKWTLLWNRGSPETNSFLLSRGR